MTPTESAIQRWLSQTVDFGGEIMSRASVYEWFKSEGYPARAADLWLIGYENTHKMPPA